MKAIIKVLTRTFAVTFYERNALFFFLLIGIAGGFMSGKDHVALASAIAGHPLLTLIPIILWILYGLKIWIFNSQLSDESQLRLIRDLSLLTGTRQLLSFAPVILIQDLPVLIYGAFLMSIAFYSDQVISGWIILINVLTIPALLTIALYLKFNYPQREPRITKLKSWIDSIVQRPFILFFPELTIGQKPGQTIVSKLFSCLLIAGISRLYYFEAYDYRFIAMGSLIAFATMQILIFDYVHFENKSFSMLRSLPWSLSKRMINFILSMLLVALPELFTLLGYFPKQLSWVNYLEVVALCFSFLIFSYTSLIFKNMDLEHFSQRAFITTLAAVILVLFKIPLLLLITVALAVSAYRYRQFYSFEETGESKETESAIN